MVLHRDLWPGSLLSAEIAQRRDEGYNLGDLLDRIEAAIASGTIAQRAEAFWTEIESWQPVGPDVEREETLDMETRRAAAPSDGDSPPRNLSETALVA